MKKTLAQVIIRDMTEIVGRPLFSSDEAEVLIDLMDDKIEKAIKQHISFYVKQNQTLADLIDFEEEGGSYNNMIEGF